MTNNNIWDCADMRPTISAKWSIDDSRFFYRVNYNKTVITKAPLAPNFVKILQVAANSPTITIAPINWKTPGPASASKKPTLSVVIRDVSQDISAEEIATLCPSLSIVKAWRIVSRKSNRPTSFIRVLTTDKP
jgi:hypothetical protein